ncbi:MAG: lactate utilization protein [Marinilabiliaceae bacterium]|nr:lactate utilization protein [Marinilabiliaceae bacterium]
MSDVNCGSRDAILEKLRKGRSERTESFYEQPDWNDDVVPVPVNLLDTFKDELETIKGEVFVGESDDDLVELLKMVLAIKNLDSVFCVDTLLLQSILNKVNVISDKKSFNSVKAIITRCENLVARTGSVFVSSAHESGRRFNIFPDIHIVWAMASQLVPMVEDAIIAIKERYLNGLPSQITAITGPSRTADIEKTLVLGAHGPKELIVLINRNA